ncbi:MAG: hypothetical protein QOD77_603 [Thermoplasmata archaeon]|jgi:hypothetical protein|nr:hypothetical protein [Thermoplasmata archaeon]
MRPASLALPALALLLLLPAAQAQVPSEIPFMITNAQVADAIGPGETTKVSFQAVRACSTTSPILPAGTLQLERAASPFVTLTGAMDVPVPEHNCLTSGHQAIAFELQATAGPEIPEGIASEAVLLRAHVDQASPTHTTTSESAISFIVPFKAKPVPDSYIGPVEESPVLAPGVILAALGALASRKR